MITFDTFPSELTTVPQWIGWRFVFRREHGEEKPTKVPVDLRTGKHAKVNDRATWLPYLDARARLGRSEVNGIAFVVTVSDPFTGIDLDHVHDRMRGTLTSWAREMVRTLDSYTEITPSGTGVRIWVRGRVPGTRKKKGNANGRSAFEIYDAGRFFTVTGHHLAGTPREIRERQDALDAVYAEVFGPTGTCPLSGPAAAAPDVEPNDDALITKAKRHAKFAKLWQGDWSGLGYPSQSEADLRLCTYLRYWTGGDADRMDRLFRRSRLMRPKWDEMHGQHTYGVMTLEKSLRITFSPPPDVNGQKPADPSSSPPPRNRTDIGNAERLVDRYGNDLYFDHTTELWMVWNEDRWLRDEDGQHQTMAKETVRAIYAEAEAEPDDTTRRAIAQHAMRSESDARIDAMLSQARSDRAIAVTSKVWDTDLWALNCLNGTIDLRTGELRPHRREDRITKLAPVFYDPEARAPLWAAFLARIMDNNNDVIRFLQRASGYSASGLTRERVVMILWGMGANGKSTFLNTVAGVLGDYAKPADPGLLLAHRNERHPTGIADLFGARFVTAVETGSGKRLNEELLKWLTSTDLLKARYMRRDFFTFVPTHTFWLAVNRRPVIRGTDKAIWDRIRLVPFVVTIPEKEQDRELEFKLREESSGILRWIVEGCVAWQHEGLVAPEAVIEAGKDYREESDTLGRFLEECCIEDKGAETESNDLYKAYTVWCLANNERAETQTALGTLLGDRRFKRRRIGSPKRTWWLGIRLSGQGGQG